MKEKQSLESHATAKMRPKKFCSLSILRLCVFNVGGTFNNIRPLIKAFCEDVLVKIALSIEDVAA